MARRFLRNPFASLFASSKREQHLTRYVLREHAQGRTLDDILEDAFIRNRTSPEQRGRLLENPELIAGIGDNAIADLRAAGAQAGRPIAG